MWAVLSIKLNNGKGCSIKKVLLPGTKFNIIVYFTISVMILMLACDSVFASIGDKEKNNILFLLYQ